MDVSKIKTASQLRVVMDQMNPLSKEGVLLLQAMSNEGKDDVVKKYEKMFEDE